MPRAHDRDFLASLDSDSQVMQFIHGGPLARQAALRFADAVVELAPHRLHFHRWLVALSVSGEPIGWAELSKFRHGCMREDLSDDIQLGYQFAPAFWRQGYATEASLAVLTHAFARFAHLDRIVAFARPEHTASLRVLEKLGFVRQGYCRDDARQICDFLVLAAESFRRRNPQFA